MIGLKFENIRGVILAVINCCHLVVNSSIQVIKPNNMRWIQGNPCLDWISKNVFEANNEGVIIACLHGSVVDTCVVNQCVLIHPRNHLKAYFLSLKKPYINQWHDRVRTVTYFSQSQSFIDLNFIEFDCLNFIPIITGNIVASKVALPEKLNARILLILLIILTVFVLRNYSNKLILATNDRKVVDRKVLQIFTILSIATTSRVLFSCDLVYFHVSFIWCAINVVLNSCWGWCLVDHLLVEINCCCRQWVQRKAKLDWPIRSNNSWNFFPKIQGKAYFNREKSEVTILTIKPWGNHWLNSVINRNTNRNLLWV